MSADIRYRITLLPRQRGPFAEHVVVESGAPPRFEGGAVIVTQPKEGHPGKPQLDRTPLYMAWPLDTVSAVIVDELPGDDE
jgi:hypothetical protein